MQNTRRKISRIFHPDINLYRISFLASAESNHALHRFDPEPNAGIRSPGGLRLSPDEFLLNVSDSAGKWVWSFEIQDDGPPANAEPFHRLETPDDSSATGAAFKYTTSRDA